MYVVLLLVDKALVSAKFDSHALGCLNGVVGPSSLVIVDGGVAILFLYLYLYRNYGVGKEDLSTID